MMIIHLLQPLKIVGGFQAFLQTQYKWNADHQLLLGWRTDLHTVHGVIHSPRLNYQLNLSDQTVMRLGMGNGFRVVNVFTEDHAALTGAREIVFRESLEPERSKNINLNISTDRILNGVKYILSLQFSIAISPIKLSLIMNRMIIKLFMLILMVVLFLKNWSAGWL